MLVAPRNRHVVVASPCDTGSNRLNAGTIPVPACDTVNVWPAIVAVAVRSMPDVDATFKTTVPVPLPVLPARIVMNDDDVVAVHTQPAAVVTVTVALPPAAPMLALVADNTYVHVVAGVVVVVVVVVLGAAGVESFEQAAALRATARSPSRGRSFIDEITSHNIAAPDRLVKVAWHAPCTFVQRRRPARGAIGFQEG